ncbi:MAG TPA: hypothetical protein VNL18_05730, partial [Gemmatimonadales bacterium]|nr:hypothetical protein [Gemmatimonadales bacterium]
MLDLGSSGLEPVGTMEGRLGHRLTWQPDAAATGCATIWYQLIRRPSASTARRQVTAFAFGVLVLLAALNVYAPGSPTPLQRLLASLIIVAAAVPTFRWLRDLDPGVAFMPFWGLVYAGYYAAPVFLLERFSRAYYLTGIIADESIERALILALLGVLVTLVGYCGPFVRPVASLMPKLEMRWERQRISPAVVGYVLGSTGLVAYLVSVTLSVPVWIRGILSWLGDLSLVAIVYLFLVDLLGYRSRTGRLFLWVVLVPLRFVLGVTSGATYQGLSVMAVLMLTYATTRRRVPVAWIVVGVSLFVVLRTIQVPFRDLTWQEGRSAIGVFERGSVMAEISLRAIGQEDFLETAWQVGLSRISHLMTLAEVVGLTPEYVPFWGGETYRPIIWKLVPRLIYPDKPMETTGQEFGHRYGFLAADDFVTSYNLPQLVEFYANFGVLGVGFGMFFIGVFYRLVQAMFVHPRMGLGAAVAVLYLSTKLLLIESGLSLVLGGVFQGVLFVVLVHAGLVAWTVV